MHFDLLIVGGGAAGYFCAANLQLQNKKAKVAILEKGRESLSKVRISGGGRCNLTHACFQNSQLVKNYPRGKSFLKKAFTEFSCQDTVDWFNERGVDTKVEADGRMFPLSNSSQSIIDCLQSEISQVEIIHSTNITSIRYHEHEERERFSLSTKNDKQFSCQYLMLATGSNERVWSHCLSHTGGKVALRY